MNKSIILGIGTACPEHTMSQAEALTMFTDIVCEDARQRRLAKVLFRKSGVKNRHTVVPHTAAYTWGKRAEPVAAGRQGGELSRDFLIAPDSLPEIIPGESAGPTTGERMQMYREFAADLALQSATSALLDSRLEPSQITHLVVITCTGFDSPGVDVQLINRLGLPATTQRVNVGFMGCHAAINGLRAASAISKADPEAKVLMTAVELCSLHYRFQWDMEGIIGNALFADGSASLVIGNRNPEAVVGTDAPIKVTDNTPEPDDSFKLGIFESQPEDADADLANQQPAQPNSPMEEDWNVVATGSVLIGDSCETMSWTVGDHGFEMLLTNEIGDRIEASLEAWLVDWLDKFELTMDSIDLWGVHPGGPRILSAVQKSLSLTDDDLATSRSVLQRYGNMSSPTVLFILKEFIEAQRINGSQGEGSNCLLLAFGPGLVAEIALLQR